MHFDAQIQMIVSTFKLAQALELDSETQHASMRYIAKCQGGARAQGFFETQAVVSIKESSTLIDNSLGQVIRSDDKFLLNLVAPREYFTGLIQLFPHCQPETGGYLSFDFLVLYERDEHNDVELMKVVSAEYKMVKELSSNPDLISRG